MDRQQMVALPLVVLALFILMTTIPMRYSHQILIPALVPVFGIPVLGAFLAGQVAVVAAMTSRKGLAWLAVGLVVGFGLAWVGHLVRSSAGTVEHWPRDGVCGAVCVSALLLGWRLWKSKL